MAEGLKAIFSGQSSRSKRSSSRRKTTGTKTTWRKRKETRWRIAVMDARAKGGYWQLFRPLLPTQTFPHHSPATSGSVSWLYSAWRPSSISAKDSAHSCWPIFWPRR